MEVTLLTICPNSNSQLKERTDLFLWCYLRTICCLRNTSGSHVRLETQNLQDRSILTFLFCNNLFFQLVLPFAVLTVKG